MRKFRSKYIDSVNDIFERIENKKVVFTNGCFDIVHSGHVEYLEKCKDYGDILIVGLNSDSSIKRIKGIDRPINSIDVRKCIVAGLESVDYVIEFETDTPIDLIKLIKPNVYVKGGDYTLDNMVGENKGFYDIREYCEEAYILKFASDISTTKIINHIRKGD